MLGKDFQNWKHKRIIKEKNDKLLDFIKIANIRNSRHTQGNK